MTGFAFWLFAACVACSNEQAGQQLTVERIYDEPSLAGVSPRQLKISPDARFITYLKNKKDEQERYDLWAYDVEKNTRQMLVDSRELAGDEKELSAEEKARRERQRLFAKGIVDYFWSDDSKSLVFPLNGDIFHYRLTGGDPKNTAHASRQLTATEAFETDVKLSPNGKAVSFVRDQDLFVIDVVTGKERALTTDGEGPIKNAMAEFVAQEEMDRHTGYWWSPDSKRIAFLQVDESPVGLEQRYEINADSLTVTEQRYPRTGTANVLLKLGVIELATGDIRWLDLGKNTDIYIPRVNWFPDSRHLAVQRQSRDQQTLDLIRYQVDSGEARTLITEQSPTWINLHHDLHFIKERDQFVWASERDGFKHLYLYSHDGKLLGQLTQGDWMVNEVVSVDGKQGQVYFTAAKQSPLEKHLYLTDLDASTDTQPQRITQREGWHEITFADNGKVYVDDFSSPQVPPQVSLHAPKGQLLAWLEQNALEPEHPFWPFHQSTAQATFGELKASDGQTLFYRLYKPVDMKKGKRYPVIVDVYGGPGVQRVKKVWGARNTYWHKMMSQRGFVIFSLDNRGSTNRGKKFEDPLYQQLGVVELEDQLTGVEYLKSLDFVDPERIGIFGWSYGGYMTLMAMMKAGDTFAAGVSVAPVTDWTLYDTHYTERYLGKPQDNGHGYEKSNVFPYVKKLNGPLLNIHGMADDNVLYLNSTKLYKELQQHNKPFYMMDYPGSKHSLWGQEVRTHVFTTITRFFEQHLKQTASK